MAWYQAVCLQASVEVSRGAPFWGSSADLCDVAAGDLCAPPDPRVLAQQAIGRLEFVAPPVVTAPPQGSEGTVVEIPIWLWVAPESAGPVSATARVIGVDWDMGDGGVRAAGWGRRIRRRIAVYTYERASTNHVPGEGPWPLTATWEITWTGDGMTGRTRWS